MVNLSALLRCTLKNIPILKSLTNTNFKEWQHLVEHQYKGLSSALLQVAFPIVKQNLCHLVWCNAREEAIGFYKKMGFEGIGDLFDIPPGGKHLLMVKYLDK